MARAAEAQRVARIGGDQGGNEGERGEAAEIGKRDVWRRQDCHVAVQRATYTSGMLQMQTVRPQSERLRATRDVRHVWTRGPSAVRDD